MLKRLFPKKKNILRQFGAKSYYPKKDYGPVYHEYKRYKDITYKARLHNKNLYSQKQDEIDLDWIKEYEEEQYKVMIRWAMKARTNAARDSFKETEKRRRVEEKEEEKTTMLRNSLINAEIERANRSRILKTLEIDSTNWFNPRNIDKKLKETVVVPDVIDSQSDYYRRLQELVMAYETADFEGLDEKVYMKTAIRYKNSILVPLFSRIKGLAAFLNRDGERKLLDEYETARALILKNSDFEHSEEKLGKLDQIYNGLILSLRKELKKPGNLVNHLHERFLIFYNLLRLWKEYTNYLRMGSEEIYSEIDAQMDQETTKNLDDAEAALYYTSDAEIKFEDGEEAEGIADEDDLDLTKIRQNMMKDFQNESADSLKSGKRIVDNDSEFDTEMKSIDETTLNTSDFESSSLVGLKIEEAIDWSELDQEVADEMLEEEFADLIEENKLYGEFSKSKAQRVDDLLLKLEVERIVPKSVAEKTFDFETPILEKETVDDIRNDYNINKTTDLSTLNSSIFVKISQEKLSSINLNLLTSKEKRKLKDLLFLLDRIGNIKINESDMLLKVIENS